MSARSILAMFLSTLLLASAWEAYADSNDALAGEQRVIIHFLLRRPASTTPVAAKQYMYIMSEPLVGLWRPLHLEDLERGHPEQSDYSRPERTLPLLVAEW